MVKVAGQLSKLGASGILLTLLLLHKLFFVVLVELCADLFVLGFNVVQVLLAGVEVMLILAGVESAVAVTVRGNRLTIFGSSWPAPRRTCSGVGP